MTRGVVDVRRRILARIQRFPGLHVRELAREEGLSEALALHHLDSLTADGITLSRDDGGFRRFYAATGAGPAEEDRDTLELLRQRVPLQIVVLLLEQGVATHTEMMAETALRKAAVSYQLGKLKAGGIVGPALEGPGFRLVDPRRIERLLVRWNPPPDLTDRFAALWRSFYTRRGKPGAARKD